jgi:hypothetical protein
MSTPSKEAIAEKWVKDITHSVFVAMIEDNPIGQREQVEAAIRFGIQSAIEEATDSVENQTFNHIKNWAYNYESGYWSITNGVEIVNGKKFGGPLIGIAMSEKSAKNICDAHNASLKR